MRYGGKYVCSWHKADIDFDAEHVCFRGQSGHTLIGWPMSANDPKATLCRRVPRVFVPAPRRRLRKSPLR